MHKIDSFKHSWLFHEKEFSSPIQMIWQIVLVTFSPYRYGYNHTEIWLDCQPPATDLITVNWCIHEYAVNFSETVSHINCFYIIFVYFFSSPFPLVPTTPNTKWKEEESEATQDVGHRGREGPEREWTQVSGINWRLEDAKHVVLVIPWLQGHVCSDIWPLWINQKNLMRMSFCAYLKAEWHYVFKYIMLHSTLSAYKKWSRHKEILVISVSPETLDYVQLFPRKFQVPHCCVF